MRKGRDGEEENNDGNSGPLTSLPVGLPKVDRLQRRRSCQKLERVNHGGRGGWTPPQKIVGLKLCWVVVRFVR